MFAAREQENLIHNHQQLAASKPLNASNRNAPPKTPGAQYPKTPLKIPLRDENAPTAFKTNKGKAAGLNTQFVTPMGAKTATRAPLGAKTTNAKARAAQTPAGNKDDKIQIKPTSNRRTKQRISLAENSKIEVHGDIQPTDQKYQDREPEYCPPRVPYPPYESDDFPDGCIDYTPITGANLMRGFQQYYHNPVDFDGKSIKLKRQEAAHQKARDEADAQIMAAIDQIDWSIPEEPATSKVSRDSQLPKQKKNGVFPTKPSIASRPDTAISRKAAATLSHVSASGTNSSRTFSSRPPTIAKGPMLMTKTRSKPMFPAPSVTDSGLATMRSRNTIGYTKGRTASNLVQTNKLISTASTKTPAARAAQTQITSEQSHKKISVLVESSINNTASKVKDENEAATTISRIHESPYSIYDLALGDSQAGFGDDQDLSGGVRKLSLDDHDEENAALDELVHKVFPAFEDDDEGYVFTLDEQ